MDLGYHLPILQLVVIWVVDMGATTIEDLATTHEIWILWSLCPATATAVTITSSTAAYYTCCILTMEDGNVSR